MRACNAGAIARVSAVPLTGAAELFVLFLSRDVGALGLLVSALVLVVGAADCISLHVFVLKVSVLRWGVVH